MGTRQSLVAEGYVRVTGEESYQAARGYGFTEGKPRAFALRPPPSDPPFRMPLTEHLKEHATLLLVDGVRSREEIIFRVEVPNGAYRVTVSLGDLLTLMGSVSLYANNRLILSK